MIPSSTRLARPPQDGQEVEVQAAEYVEALKKEAAHLRAELVRMEEEKRLLVSRVRPSVRPSVIGIPRVGHP